ncbi:hypothetical protein [Pontibacter liquoris]|uniref:hypothetical protein n=1 Tax=Pontibacter liquoris TaxID=2905677 RepID=UPI001FA7F66A|nr:hypothetical protein [Pontibacter liquoris]
MLLYQDHLIKLDYATAQDILYVEWQERKPYSVAEVRQAFSSIVATVREKEIERILLDFTGNTVDLSDKEYKAVMAHLTVGLLPTCLKKVARITTSDVVREEKIICILKEIESAIALPVDVKLFSTRTEALKWLLQPIN